MIVAKMGVVDLSHCTRHSLFHSQVFLKRRIWKEQQSGVIRMLLMPNAQRKQLAIIALLTFCFIRPPPMTAFLISQLVKSRSCSSCGITLVVHLSDKCLPWGCISMQNFLFYSHGLWYVVTLWQQLFSKSEISICFMYGMVLADTHLVPFDPVSLWINCFYFSINM